MSKTTLRKLTAAIAAIGLIACTAMPMASMAATITIEDANVSVEGRTFKAYKIFTVDKVDTGVEEDGEKVYTYGYTIVDAWKNVVTAYPGFNLTADSDNDDIVEAISNLETAEQKQSFANYLKNKIPAGAEFTENGEYADGSVTIDVGANPGYYLVVEENTTASGATALSAVMLQTAADEAEIAIKTDAPTIKKKIYEETDNVEGVNREQDLYDANTANIGDDVKYYVTANIPDTTYYTSYYFKMTDTFDAGLTYNNDLVITVEDESGTVLKTLVKDTDYTVTPNGQTIEINFLTMKELGTDYDGSDLVLQYSAEVNENAVVGETGNENEIKLQYSNDPSQSDKDSDHDGVPDSSDDDDDNDGTPDTPDDLDTDDDGTPDISDDDDDNDGTKDEDDDDDDGDNIPDEDETDTDGDGTSDEHDDDDDNDGTPDEDETISKDETTPDVVVTYLSQFSIIKENDSNTKLSGAGFTIYSDADCKTPILFKPGTDETGAEGKYIVAAAGDEGAVEQLVTDASGTLVIYGLEAGTYYFKETKTPQGYNGIDAILSMELTASVGNTEILNTEIVHVDGQKCAWTYTASNDAQNGYTSTGNEVTVINKSGSLFPTTGGMGTALFTAGGVTLMACAAGLYIVRRRSSAK